MARIRTIKPEFFTSEDIVSMSPLARLFYVSLWCEADRDGRLEWRPGTLKLRYFPGDTCSVDQLADELRGRGLIVFYEVNGKPYAEIPSFAKHQVINNRESPSALPPRVQHASTTRQPRAKAEGKEGREGMEGDSTEPPSDSPPAITIPLIGGIEHPVTTEQLSEWASAYPAVDVMQELREMRTWSLANPAQRKTPKGVNAFVVRWLGKEQDKGGRSRQSSENQFAGSI